MLNIFIIKSHYTDTFDQCIDSLTKHTVEDFLYTVVEEEQTREETLNKIFSMIEDTNIIIAADDIIFTNGWDTALKNNYKSNHISGCFMKSAITDKVHNCGFDIISIDGSIETSPILEVERQKEDGSLIECDTFTGCFMSIPKEVLKKINKVPLEGMNRIGELIFHCLAKEAGFKVSVIAHYLKHFSSSTKRNPDKKLTNESYMYERKIWDKAIKKYPIKNYVTKKYITEFSKKFDEIFQQPTLVYGAGSICARLLKQNKSNSSLSLCSGLKHEAGSIFFDHEVHHYEGINFSLYKNILITVKGRENAIMNDIKSLLDDKHNVFYIHEEIINNLINYQLKQINV
tara:strand:- start:4040 stop:5071 length:1032 start_codon:yes stop_codon:yes gene_type:complete